MHILLLVTVNRMIILPLLVYAEVFRVFVIYRTLTWTTGYLTCARDHCYVCLYTQGVGHTDSESAQHFLIGKTHPFFYCAPDAGGVRTRVSRVINYSLESDALRIGPPRHPVTDSHGLFTRVELP